MRTTLLSVKTVKAVSRSTLKPSIPLKVASSVACPLQTYWRPNSDACVLEMRTQAALVLYARGH